MEIEMNFISKGKVNDQRESRKKEESAKSCVCRSIDRRKEVISKGKRLKWVIQIRQKGRRGGHDVSDDNHLFIQCLLLKKKWHRYSFHCLMRKWRGILSLFIYISWHKENSDKENIVESYEDFITRIMCFFFVFFSSRSNLNFNQMLK